MQSSRRPPKPAAINRRQVLHGAAGLIAAPLLAGCQGGRATALSAAARSAAPFSHGVASGDPLADAVILWTRVDSSVNEDVSWRIYADADGEQLLQDGVVTATAERDHTVKIDVTGLQPGKTYYYDFAAAGGRSEMGRTRTLPADGIDRLRVALATCSITGSVFNAYARIAERDDLDVVLHLGDYLYADADATLAQYRNRHKAYKADHAELRELHRRHPMIAIWDDHEVTNDAYQDGAPPPNPAVGPFWEIRKGWATQAYFEYLPVREQPGGRLYRDFSFGQLMQLVMLDGRLAGRDPQVSGENDPQRDDPERSMLGFEQEQWMTERLRGSSATWKLIGNQTMLGHLNELAGDGSSTNRWMDQWDGYPPARQRFYDVLKGDAQHAPVDNVVVCTGDWHNSFIMDLPQDPKNGYEPSTGQGSLAVEFVTPSITSGFFSVSDLAPHSPHIKHHNDARHGYVILDISPERVVGEEWHVDTVAEASTKQQRAIAFQIDAGSNRLRALPTTDAGSET